MNSLPISTWRPSPCNISFLRAAINSIARRLNQTRHKLRLITIGIIKSVGDDILSLQCSLLWAAPLHGHPKPPNLSGIREGASNANMGKAPHRPHQTTGHHPRPRHRHHGRQPHPHYPGRGTRQSSPAAWDAGVRYVDTAPFYGVGAAEHRVGDALRDKRRDDCGPVHQGRPPAAPQNRYRPVR